MRMCRGHPSATPMNFWRMGGIPVKFISSSFKLNNMSRTEVFSGSRKAQTIKDRKATALALIEQFAGFTLDQVGHINGLSAEDVKFGRVANPKTGAEMRFLKLNIKGEWIPFNISKSFDIDHAKANPEWFLRCEFRGGFTQKKDDQGNVLVNGDGTPQLSDMPYLSFGKPGGFAPTVDEDAFQPLDEEQLARLKAGNVLVNA